MTRRLEGDDSSSGYGSPWHTLPNLQSLWVHYIAASERPQSHSMSSTIEFALQELNIYFEILNIKPDVIYYAVSTTLHPAVSVDARASETLYGVVQEP